MNSRDQALQHGFSILKEIKSGKIDTEVLLRHVLNISAEQLFLELNKNISKQNFENFTKLIHRRKNNEPLAYLIGHKEFYKLDFLVNKNTLIPRPETELLIDKTIEYLQKNKNIKTLIDIGTGSGCIAITIAKYFPKLKVIAIDISDQALFIAQKNIIKHQVQTQVKLIKSNLLKNIHQKIIQNPFIITANLPYVENTYNISEEVKHEPSSALFAGKNGLDDYLKLFPQIKDIKCAAFFLETGPFQIKKLLKHIKNIFPKSITKISNDLNNLERCVSVEL